VKELSSLSKSAVKEPLSMSPDGTHVKRASSYISESLVEELSKSHTRMKGLYTMGCGLVPQGFI